MSEFEKELLIVRAKINTIERLKTVGYSEFDSLVKLKAREAELAYKVSNGCRTFLEGIGDWFEEHL